MQGEWCDQKLSVNKTSLNQDMIWISRSNLEWPTTFERSIAMWSIWVKDVKLNKSSTDGKIYGGIWNRMITTPTGIKTRRYRPEVLEKLTRKVFVYQKWDKRLRLYPAHEQRLWNWNPARQFRRHNTFILRDSRVLFRRFCRFLRHRVRTLRVAK